MQNVRSSQVSKTLELWYCSQLQIYVVKITCLHEEPWPILSFLYFCSLCMLWPVRFYIVPYTCNTWLGADCRSDWSLFMLCKGVFFRSERESKLLLKGVFFILFYIFNFLLVWQVELPILVSNLKNISPS